MTDHERIAALEARLAIYDAFFTFGLSVDLRVPYVMTMGRMGIMTKFWAEKEYGQGAGFSVGCNDRYAGYFEVDEGPDGFAVCPNHPSTAVYGSVVVPHRPGEEQPNIAFEAHAANSPYGNLPFYGDYQYAPQSPLSPTEGMRLVERSADGQVQRQVSFSANMVTLKDGVQVVTFFGVQKVGSVIVTSLWPA